MLASSHFGLGWLPNLHPIMIGANADSTDMKSFMLQVVVLGLMLGGAGQLAAGNVLVQIHAAPLQEGAMPMQALRDISDAVESIVMDWFFEFGHIVSSEPPILGQAAQALEPSPGVRARTLWLAEQSKASVVVIVSLGTGPWSLGTGAAIEQVRVEVHPLAALSMARSKSLNAFPQSVSQRASALSGVLRELMLDLL